MNMCCKLSLVVDVDCRRERGLEALMSLVVLCVWSVCVSLQTDTRVHCMSFSQRTCASLLQDEGGTLDKNEVLEKKDPTHYSKLDPKALKVSEEYYFRLLFKMHKVISYQ